MAIKCPPREIPRDAFTATRKSTGKEYKVDEVCIKDLGKPGKTPLDKRIPLEKDGLGKYGYENIIRTPTEERRKSLTKAIKGIQKEKNISEHDSAVKVMKRLNVLSILNKNTNVTLSLLLERDRNWVGRNYLGVDYARKK